jgi:ornithine cyclodeaminase/alanine dehydrogenase-like protein (mu-crystallin family)
MDTACARVLRIHPEPFVCVDELKIHRLLTRDPRSYLSFVQKTIESVARGRFGIVLPAKQVFTDTLGDFRLMPCVLTKDGKHFKTVKLIGTNLLQKKVPDQITVGKAFCLHPNENFITHIFDACLLTSARTGALAALAVKKMSPKAKTVGLIGSGRVGFFAAFYLSVLMPSASILIHDSDPQRAAWLSRALTARLKGKRVCASGLLSVKQCDSIILATPSKKPVLSAKNVRAKTLISLGADAVNQRELHDAWAMQADIYVDSKDAFKSGDLRAWVQKKVVSRHRVKHFFKIFLDRRNGNSRKKILISVGSGLLDNITIAYLLGQINGKKPF